MLKKKKEFVAALVVVVMVFVLLALPYAVTEAYGLKAQKLILLVRLVVLTVFSAALLIWWLVRYRQTSRDLKMLQEELERNKRADVASRCLHSSTSVLFSVSFGTHRSWELLRSAKSPHLHFDATHSSGVDGYARRFLSVNDDRGQSARVGSRKR